MRDFIALLNERSRLVVRKTIPEKYLSSLRKTAMSALRLLSLWPESCLTLRKTSALSSNTMAFYIVAYCKIRFSLYLKDYGMLSLFNSPRDVDIRAL